MVKTTLLWFMLVIGLTLHYVYSDSAKAECILKSNPSYQSLNITGTIILTQDKPGELDMNLNLQGFTANGTHGFHVHESPNIDTNCEGAGVHFNPFNKTHGGPEDSERHVGDFGNIIVYVPSKQINVKDSLATLYLNQSETIIDRALVIHEWIDDLGRGNSSVSNTTGNAGARLACCVIKCTKGSCLGKGMALFEPRQNFWNIFLSFAMFLFYI